MSRVSFVGLIFSADHYVVFVVGSEIMFLAWQKYVSLGSRKILSRYVDSQYALSTTARYRMSESRRRTLAPVRIGVEDGCCVVMYGKEYDSPIFLAPDVDCMVGYTVGAQGYNGGNID